jgi:hypothetical protein
MASRERLGLIAGLALVGGLAVAWTSSGYVMRKIVTTCVPAWF